MQLKILFNYRHLIPNLESKFDDGTTIYYKIHQLLKLHQLENHN